MSTTINHKAVSYMPLNTDQQKNRANAFINKSDKELNQIALRASSIQNHKSNKNLVKNIDRAFNALPLIAVASGLASGKSAKAALKNGAEWGLAVAIPAIVNKANKTAVNSSDNIKQAEKKHAGMSFGAEIALSLAGFFGATALLNKASKNAKVNKIADTVIQGTKDTLNKVKKEIKVPEKLTQAYGKIAEKVKVPEFAKNTLAKVKNSQITKNIAEKGAKIGKKAIANAPGIVAVGIVGAILGSAVKQASQTAEIKNSLKRDQLSTAKHLISAYQDENQALKDELAQRAEA